MKQVPTKTQIQINVCLPSCPVLCKVHSEEECTAQVTEKHSRPLITTCIILQNKRSRFLFYLHINLNWPKVWFLPLNTYPPCPSLPPSFLHAKHFAPIFFFIKHETTPTMHFYHSHSRALETRRNHMTVARAFPPIVECFFSKSVARHWDSLFWLAHSAAYHRNGAGPSVGPVTLFWEKKGEEKRRKKKTCYKMATENCLYTGKQ